MPRHLHQQIAPSLVHPVQDLESLHRRQPLKCRLKARIDFDPTLSPTIRITPARTICATRPGRPDAPDEINPGIRPFRQRCAAFARPNGIARNHGGGLPEQNKLICDDIMFPRTEPLLLQIQNVIRAVPGVTADFIADLKPYSSETRYVLIDKHAMVVFSVSTDDDISYIMQFPCNRRDRSTIFNTNHAGITYAMQSANMVASRSSSPAMSTP